MKNLSFKSILVVLLTISSFNLFSQAFEKGNWNIDLDLGGAAYGSRTTLTLAVAGFNFTTSEEDGAVSTIFRLGGEYGISNRIGLGLKIGSSNYLIAKEDRDTVKSVAETDFAIHVNFHLLKAERNDLFLTLGLGISNAKWQYHDVPGFLLSSASGSGSYFTLGITDRIFFSDHIGVLFNLSYAGFNYRGVTPELSSTGKAITAVVPSYSLKLDFELKGVYFGTGLAVKF